MKYRIALVALFAVLGMSAQAQLKIGYTEVEYVLSLMPQSKQVESELSNYQKQVSAQLKSKYTDYQTKLAAYQKGAASMTDQQRQAKEKEITTLQGSIQQFESNAQNNLLKKRNQLLAPLFEKIGTAIEQVSKANGYTHVFNMSAGGQGILLYAREQDNVTDLVLKKLGITPPKK